MKDGKNGPRPLPRNSLALVLHGFSYPFRGLQFIRCHRLWGLTTVAIAVNAVLLVALIIATGMLAVPYVERLIGALHAWAAGTSWLETIATIGASFIWLAAGAVIFAVNGLLLLMVGQAVASPFLDMLSEKVEVTVLNTSPLPFSISRTIQSILVALGDLVWGLIYWAAVHVPLLIVGLVPALGAGIAAAGSFGFTALLLAHEFIGLALSRNLVSYRGRWRVVWANKSIALGFGAAVMVLLAVPILNLLLLPLAAVGGTLLYCDLRAAGRLRLPYATSEAG